MSRWLVSSLCALGALCGEHGSLRANPPVASYVFPAGAQRGTAVEVRVGGLFLHEHPGFEVTGPGVTHSPHLKPARRVWFEGPLLPLPESQQQEDYPADLRGSVTVAKDAPTGTRRVRLVTAQGAASGPVFVIGDLPEVVEKETDGEPIPEALKLPCTANGRVFPREDIDLWEFDAEVGKTVTAFIHTKAINSPLVPRLDVLDAHGAVVAEQTLYPCVGTDASVKFVPRVSGKYRVRVTDARALGGPAYVYRLTVMTEHVPDFHFPLKAPPDGLRNCTETGRPTPVPCALNGAIERAGAVGTWKLDLKKGTSYTFDLQARRYESPLCAVVHVLDAGGKEVAKSAASETTDPAPLTFNPPADAAYTVTISEKFRGRGGPNFVYRLRVLDAPEIVEPGFKLSVASDTFTVPRGGKLSIPVAVGRFGGFRGPIVLSATALPNGVTASAVSVPPHQQTATITLTAPDRVAIGAGALQIQGLGVAGVNARHRADAVFPGASDLKLAVALPTPFKIIDQYVMTSAPRGETYYRKYKIDRNGFDGTIHVQLADKQARHLQGVTGPVLALKQGETEFAYPALLPPWMEMGRTCRVCVMATATVRDPVDGREHRVSFSSTEQNQQMIVVVGPGRLDVSCEKTSVRAEGEVRLPIKVSRSKSLTGAARVELVLPEHVTGVTVTDLVVPANQSEGELVLKFAPTAGPFNVPLVLRATVTTDTGPVTAETKLEAVK